MTKLSQRKKGLISAFFVSFLQGSEGFIVTFMGLVVVVAGIVSTPAFSVAVLLLKETIVCVIVIIIFLPQLRSILTKLRTRAGKVLFFSGLMTSFGNFVYLLAIVLASASYGVVLTALYPIFSIILIRFFYKEKQNWKAWSGVSIAVISSLLFMIMPNLIDNLDGNFDWKKVIGMLMGGLAVLFWSFEGLLLRKANTLDPKITGKEVVFIRSLSSTFFVIILIFPFGFVFGNPALIARDIFLSWQGMIIIFAIAFALIAMRFFYFYSVKTIGVKLTAVIDSNNFLVPAFLAIFISFLELKNPIDNSYLFTTLMWWCWFLVIPIIIGVSIVVMNSND